MGGDARRSAARSARVLAGARGGPAVKTTRQLLLAWYRANRRDLPWRRSRDPYAVWISEAMLQQTRVETVIPYWERFLALFPDIPRLAAADPDAVLGAWAGLGYYSRARNLQRAAQRIVAEHAGRLPDTVGGSAGAPGHRPLHGGRRGLDRVRPPRAGGRRQRRARARAPARDPREPEARRRSPRGSGSWLRTSRAARAPAI